MSIQLTLSQIAEVVRVRENRSELTFYPKLSTVSIYPNKLGRVHVHGMYAYILLSGTLANAPLMIRSQDVQIRRITTFDRSDISLSFPENSKC